MQKNSGLHLILFFFFRIPQGATRIGGRFQISAPVRRIAPRPQMDGGGPQEISRTQFLARVPPGGRGETLAVSIPPKSVASAAI